MTINKVRNIFYKSAKYLGDANAIEKNKVPRRLARRIVGKYSARLLNGIFR
jgi:hypothetical protein